MIPISLLELSEQVVLQVFLSFCRVVMVVIMITTIFTAEASSEPTFGDFEGSTDNSESIFNIYFI